MEPVLHLAPYTGWVYPNETVFEWSVLIAVYPYLTGLVAGAFTVSSLYQVFGFEQAEAGGAPRPADLAQLHDLCAHAAAVSPRASGTRIQCRASRRI